jgi:hypothetical protein
MKNWDADFNVKRFLKRNYHLIFRKKLLEKIKENGGVLPFVVLEENLSLHSTIISSHISLMTADNVLVVQKLQTKPNTPRKKILYLKEVWTRITINNWHESLRDPLYN